MREQITCILMTLLRGSAFVALVLVMFSCVSNNHRSGLDANQPAGSDSSNEDESFDAAAAVEIHRSSSAGTVFDYFSADECFSGGLFIAVKEDTRTIVILKSSDAGNTWGAIKNITSSKDVGPIHLLVRRVSSACEVLLFATRATTSESASSKLHIDLYRFSDTGLRQGAWQEVNHLLPAPVHRLSAVHELGDEPRVFLAAEYGSSNGKFRNTIVLRSSEILDAWTQLPVPLDIRDATIASGKPNTVYYAGLQPDSGVLNLCSTVVALVSGDGGDTWTMPHELAPPGEYDKPLIAGSTTFNTFGNLPDRTVFVVYRVEASQQCMNIGTSGLYYAYSTDYGGQWSQRRHIPGTTGQSNAFAVDMRVSGEDERSTRLSLLWREGGAVLHWREAIVGNPEELAHPWSWSPPQVTGTTSNISLHAEILYPLPDKHFLAPPLNMGVVVAIRSQGIRRVLFKSR